MRVSPGSHQFQRPNTAMKRGHEERAHDRRVDEHAEREAEPELLEAGHAPGDEARERRDHDQRRRGDERPGLLEALCDGARVVAGPRPTPRASARRGRPRSPSTARTASRRGRSGSSPRSAPVCSRPSEPAPTPQRKTSTSSAVDRGDGEQRSAAPPSAAGASDRNATQQNDKRQQSAASDEPREGVVGRGEEVGALRRRAAGDDVVPAGKPAAGTSRSRSRSTRAPRRGFAVLVPPDDEHALIAAAVGRRTAAASRARR